MKTLDLHTAPLSLFWYWMNERHKIFLRRKRGKAKPWTDDPILRDYKFTNPFRENDRGTVWLRENFLEPHCDDDLGLIAGNICWYRMFNWWGTGERMGWQDSEQFMSGTFLLDNEVAFQRGEQVFTGAHIVYSTPGMSKLECITGVCEELWDLCIKPYPPLGGQSSVVALARGSRSLEQVFNLLKTVDCVGGFMAYEMVTDMRHTRLLEDARDIYTWANPGPGALRGLHRLGLPYKPRAKAIESIRMLQDRTHAQETERDGFNINYGFTGCGDQFGEWFPRIEMRDIEHSLCEFDKYCRVKFGEGEPRSKFNGRDE